MATLNKDLTISEAGFVLRQDSKVVNRAIDGRIIKAKIVFIGKTKQRTLGLAELRFLRLSSGLKRDLTPAGRKRMYEAIKQLGKDAHRVKWGVVEVDLKPIDEGLQERMKALRILREAVEVVDDRDPVLSGTRIPVHAIAAIAKSEGEAGVLEAYPSLSLENVRQAVEFAEAYPKAGRPYPTRSLKRMICDLAESGVFDAEPEERVSIEMFK